MILIADCGSTKCDWALLSKNHKHVATYHSVGFNPYYNSAENIKSALLEHPDLKPLASDVSHVFYYGTGCSAPDRIEIVFRALAGVFRHAQILVDHDLKAAVYATFNGKPGITSILGTGSNSCFFDGKQLISKTPSLGFILGDEGSGCFFGKQVLTYYFYGKFPTHVANAFKTQYPDVDLKQTIHAVYQESRPNVYMAQFTRFIAAFNTEPIFQEMLYAGFESFFKLHIIPYTKQFHAPVHVIGSVGSIFKNEINTVASDLGVEMGSFIQKPLDAIVEYHQNYIL